MVFLRHITISQEKRVLAIFKKLVEYDPNIWYNPFGISFDIIYAIKRFTGYKLLLIYRVWHLYRAAELS